MDESASAAAAAEGEGEGKGLNPKERGEFERRRGWRVDQGTLERFRGLVDAFHGSQYVFYLGWQYPA
jgi:tRNA pseudouridine38-40 synthase